MEIISRLFILLIFASVFGVIIYISNTQREDYRRYHELEVKYHQLELKYDLLREE